MAESQLMCMEDGRIGTKVPESKPEFYYSEEQRRAIEELLRNGDGAFKTRLKEDNVKDFLSAREVKLLTSTFKQYASSESGSAAPRGAASSDSGVHSTYWPQMSDTEVPPLDLGWTSGGMFKGVTRVSVHTHPPKDNGPHIKEVVRKLIQEANKVIAIVMDMLTDVQILQDLMDAAWRRSVPIYILLDEQAMPHFLDMCSRLQIGTHHLRVLEELLTSAKENIRTRILQGVGFGLSFGRLPGSLQNKYMLIDGDKVMFGSYSFSWCTSRMDRNMITVMTGQVVDFFDRDFRELYAISEKLDLFKEFNVGRPANTTSTLRSKSEPKRPPLPATTSRFQVSLGDSQNPDIQVPAHKYYNPKYFLAFADTPPRPTGSLQEPGPKKDLVLAEISEEPGTPRLASSERMDRLSPLPSEEPEDLLKMPPVEKKTRSKKKFSLPKLSRKAKDNHPAGSEDQRPLSADASRIDDSEDNIDVMVKTPPRGMSKKPSKLGSKQDSLHTVNSAQDREGVKHRRSKHNKCTLS